MPEQVIVSLAEIAHSAREGLLALSVGVGLQAMASIIDEDVTVLCGPRDKHNPGRIGYRRSTEQGLVTLGGRRVPVRRPRVRAADGSGELTLPSYQLFSSTDMLGEMAMERMLAGLSTRRYAAGHEPVGEQGQTEARSTSRIGVSRRFVRQKFPGHKPAFPSQRRARLSGGGPSLPIRGSPAAMARATRVSAWCSMAVPSVPTLDTQVRGLVGLDDAELHASDGIGAVDERRLGEC